jgi:hypothetical protein
MAAYGDSIAEMPFLRTDSTKVFSCECKARGVSAGLSDQVTDSKGETAAAGGGTPCTFHDV